MGKAQTASCPRSGQQFSVLGKLTVTGLFCALIITFSFSSISCGNPAGGDPRGGTVYNFTANAEVGGGIITFELEKDNSGARAAANTYGLSGKLKDGSTIVPLSGTFLPGLGVYTASASSGDRTINITGTINVEGKLVDSKAGVYNRNTGKAASFPIREGGSAIAGTAVLDTNVPQFPAQFFGTWRGENENPDDDAEKLGITTKQYTLALLSPEALISGLVYHAEWDGGSLDFTMGRDIVQVVSVDKREDGIYDIIVSGHYYAAMNLEERKASFGAYLDGLVEKGTISEEQKTFYLGKVLYSPNPNEILDEGWIQSKEDYIRYLEDCSGYLDGNFEVDYFMKQGRNPGVLYQRMAMIIINGEYKALNFRLSGNDPHSYEQEWPDLNWLKSQPLEDGIDGQGNNSHADGDIMDDMEKSETHLPWN